jgi:hypothetical protein
MIPGVGYEPTIPELAGLSKASLMLRHHHVVTCLTFSIRHHNAIGVTSAGLVGCVAISLRNQTPPPPTKGPFRTGAWSQCDVPSEML